MQDTSQITPVTLDSELDQILADLDDFEGRYPKSAIAAARQHREAVIPRLIEAIESSMVEWEESGEVAGNTAFFALCLLAEFRAKEALPVILRAISLPDDGPYELFGDLVTECLSRNLAELCDDMDLIDSVISNTDLDEYVRSAAMGVYLELVYDGRITRDAAVAKLQQHLKNAIAHQDAEGATWLVSRLADYGPHEAMEDIREAFRRNLVEDFVINLKDVDKCLTDEFAERLKMVGQRRQSHPVDAVESWAWFRDDEPERPLRHLSNWPVNPFLFSPDSLRNAVEDLDEEWDDEPVPPEPVPAVGTIRYVEARIGRNDPCPCGSGKKFKKCCGSH